MLIGNLERDIDNRKFQWTCFGKLEGNREGNLQETDKEIRWGKQGSWSDLNTE